MIGIIKEFYNNLNNNREEINLLEEEGVRKYILFILFVSAFLCLPLLLPGYYWGHDGLFPLYRLVSMDEAFKSGQIPIKVLPNLVNGFGYGWNIFYAPLAYDVTFVIHKLGLPILASMKVFLFLTIFLSGLFMYFFVKKLSKDNTMSTIAAIFYMTSPYRLVDIYVRSAYAESLTFVFLPLIFLGLYNIIYEDGKKYPILGLGLGGLILSHNITALFSIIFIAIFLVISFKVFYKFPRKILCLLKATFLTFLLSAYFVIPLIEHMLYGSYAVFKKYYMATPASVYDNSVHFFQLFLSFYNSFAGSLPLNNTENEMAFPLGTVIVIFVLASFFLIRFKDKIKRTFLPYLLCGVVATLMTTWIFPWKYMPDFMIYIQFPWRLLVFSAFFFSVFAAIFFYGIKREYRFNIILAIAIITCAFSVPFMALRYDPTVSEKNVLPYEDITKSYVLGYTCGGEYLPQKAIDNQDYLKKRDRSVKVLQGNAKISNSSTSGSIINFDVQTTSKEAVLEIPFIYYLGYKGYAVASDGSKKEIIISESKNGFCEIKMESSAKVKIYYRGTTAGIISFALSILALLFSIFILVKRKIKYHMVKGNVKGL